MTDNIEVGDLVARISFDDTGLSKSMTEIDRQMKLVKSEFDKASSSLETYGNEEEQLRLKSESLNQQLQLQKQRVNKLNDELQRAAREKGEDARETQKLATQLNNAQTALNKIQTELTQTNTKLNSQENELGQLERAWKQAMDEASQSVGNLSDQLKQAGASITAAGTAITTTLGFAVSTAADFEAQIDRVGAVAGATEKELDLLRQSALDLGSSTSKSASEVAIAQQELAALGFTVDDILGSMPGVISAAEASGADMAQTAEVMASTLNIFGLEASKANDVADILAQTANQSAADITDMQYALKYAGPPASALGVSLEELSAAIGIMTNAGMQGEQAGTTLRAALLGLLDPSEENSKMMDTMGIQITDLEGNFVGLEQLVTNLQTSMDGMTDTQKASTLSTLVGTEAVSGMLSLMSAGPAEIAKFTTALEQSSGASASTASIMRDNLKGAIDEMSGAFETLMITIGTSLTPIVRTFADTLGSLANWFNNLSPAAQQFIAIGAAVAGALALLVGPLTVLIGFLPNIIAGFTALGPVFAALTGPIGLTIAAIAGITAGLGILYAKNEQFRTFVNEVWSDIQDVIKAAWESIKSFVVPLVKDIVSFFQEQLAEVQAFWKENGEAIMAVVDVAFKYISGVIKFQMELIKTIITVAWTLIKTSIQLIWNSIKLIVSTGIDLITGIIKVAMSLFKGDWEGAWDAVKETVSNIWGNIEKFLKGIDLKQIGKDIMQGLINGIKSMADSVVQSAKDVANNISKGIKDVLGINSPSKVTTQLGEWTGEGLAIGMGNMAGAVAKQAAALSEVAIPSIGNGSLFRSASLGIDSDGGSSTVEPVQLVQANFYLDGYKIAEAIAKPQAEMLRATQRGVGFA